MIEIGPVVDSTWWHEHRSEVVLVDVRWYLDGRSGEAAYEHGHIPGAVFVDLEQWLSGDASLESGRHPLPDPAVFAAGMSQAGIANHDTVVAYDDAGGVIAARLVWMLRAIGQKAALLDGGIGQYHSELETGSPARPVAHFSPRPWPSSRLATIEETADPTKILIDARNADRYRGENDPIDPRPGHIPNARNVPCRENLTAEGTFLPIHELRRRFEEVGVTRADQVISYCGSGVTACHNLLALELAGFGQGRLYPGSWSQYSRNLDRPIATGSAPA